MQEPGVFDSSICLPSTVSAEMRPRNPLVLHLHGNVRHAPAVDALALKMPRPDLHE